MAPESANLVKDVKRVEDPRGRPRKPGLGGAFAESGGLAAPGPAGAAGGWGRDTQGAFTLCLAGRCSYPGYP